MVRWKGGGARASLQRLDDVLGQEVWQILIGVKFDCRITK
jgi:hypothetical protein